MDNNDKNFTIMQTIIAALIFFCVISCVLIHVFMGAITTFFGYLFAATLIFLSWKLLRHSWRELKM